MNVLGRLFLNSREDRCKDGKTDFVVRCRRTYVLYDTINVFFTLCSARNLNMKYIDAIKGNFNLCVLEIIAAD